jgi:hypothetical protein
MAEQAESKLPGGDDRAAARGVANVSIRAGERSRNVIAHHRDADSCVLCAH